MTIKRELQIFGTYAQAVLRAWWVLLIEAVLVITDVFERTTGTWLLPSTRTKAALGLGVLAVAQYRVYRKLHSESEQLRRVQSVKPTQLQIHEEPGSRVYIEHPNIVPQHNYFEFHVIIENSGSQQSVIRRFDLDVEGHPQLFENLTPVRRNMIQTRSAQMMTAYVDILGTTFIVAPAHDVWHGIIMLELAALPLEGANVRSTLKLTDSNGASAAKTFDMRITN